jgi:hypothetical protein
MYDLVLFVLGVALAEVATTTRLRDWSWHAVIGTLTLTIVAVAGARRASQRRRERELDQAERKGFTRGFKAFKGAGKDELRWFDHALEVFYNRYCTDELLLANWIRLTVERSLQNRELLGGVISGVTIPRFTMGESRLVCHRTTPFRVDRPEELYLDLQLKWFSECRAKVAFELHALTGGGVFTCYITNASFEGTLRIGTTFVDQRPWAGQLHLSFVETPKVDFDIEVLKGSVTLPFDLKKVVSRALHDTMTWPVKKSLPFDEWWGPNALEFEGSKPKKPPAMGVFHIEIVEAKELMKAGAGRKVGVGSADPYVRCDVDGVSKRTTVIKKSQNPRWETLLHLLVPHHDARIRVKVVDDQVLGINDKLGSFEFSAKHLTAPRALVRSEQPVSRVESSKLLNGREKLAAFCRSHVLRSQEETKEPSTPRRTPKRTPSREHSILKTLKRAGSGPIKLLERPTVDTPEQLALLVLNQRRARKCDDDGNIVETDVSTNEPLDVWLRLQGVKKGKLRTRLVYRDFSREESEHSFLAAVYVEVLEAAELAGHKGKKRARSAFVDVEVGRQKYQTETTKNANHPRWDEAATFFVADLETPSLRLTVKEAGVDAATNQITRLAQTAARAADYAAGAHARLSKDVVLGDLVISLSSDFGDRWLPLQNARSGRVHVVVTPLYLDRRTFPEPQKRSHALLDDDHYRRSTRAEEWRRHARANPRAALWQPKEDARACTRCNARFSEMSRWKHHCRLCLRVYCRDCCQKRTKVPTFGNRTPMYVCHDCLRRAELVKRGEARARDNAFLGGADESPAKVAVKVDESPPPPPPGLLGRMLSRREIAAPPPAGQAPLELQAAVL